MKIVLSPAKALNFDIEREVANPTLPAYLNQSEQLIKKLQKMSPKQLQDLMSISPKLADLNYERFAQWRLPFNGEAKPALLVFNGEAYRGLDAHSFSDKDIENAQNYLRILSGLYGILKPKDLMLPYRLEMGTKLKVTPKKDNLYKFWNTTLTDSLNKELAEDDGILVNLASNEYFKAIQPKKIKGTIITCNFKDAKNGEYKTIFVYAKHARGLMTRFIIQNEIKEVEHLKAFDLEGYSFNPNLSTETDLTFTRG